MTSSISFLKLDMFRTLKIFGFDGTALVRSRPSQRSLLDLPPEIRDEVISYVLARDPKTRIPLLLASKTVNTSTQSMVRRDLLKRVGSRYGNLAAVSLPPMPHRMGREEYLGKVDKVMTRVKRVLGFAKSQLLEKKYVYEKGEGWEAMNIRQALRLMELWLFFVEAVRWDTTITSKAWDVRRMLASLPPYGALLMRVTSLLVALTFRDEVDIYTRSSHRASRSAKLGLGRAKAPLVQAVEMDLLLHGCQNLSDMLPVPELDVTSFPNTWDRLLALLRHSVEVSKQGIAKVRAQERFSETMKLVRMYSRLRSGRLWEGQKTVMIQESVVKHRGENVRLCAVRSEDVAVLQSTATAELNGISEIDVLRELKAASARWSG